MVHRKTHHELIDELHEIDQNIDNLTNEWIWFRNEIRRLTDVLAIGEFQRSCNRISNKISIYDRKRLKVISRLEKGNFVIDDG